MGRVGKKALKISVAALSVIGLSIPLGASASAVPPEFLLRMPQADGLPKPSAGAAETTNPRGVVAVSGTGHVYVADHGNNRINEYTAWGLFVSSWGWDVAPEGAPGDTPADEFEVCGPTTPEAEPPLSLCKAGDPGAGRGQLSRPRGLAVDPSGNLYVFDSDNRRVQKFPPSGTFSLMFGADVNQTKVEAGAPVAQRNLCPVDSGDVCQAGISGEGPAQLDSTLGDFLAYSPAEGGTILVGDKGGIQVFDVEGDHKKTIAFSGSIAALAGKQVNGLDVDSAGNIYISLDGTEDVFKLSPTGEPLNPGKPGTSSFKAEEPLSVAVDVEGSVYVIDDPEGFVGASPRVVKYSLAGTKLVPTAAEQEAGGLFPERSLEARLTAIATNVCAGSEEPGDLYIGFFNAGSPPHVSYVDAYGTAPIGCEPPPPNPPIVGEQFATFVGREEATLRALINPRFFPDATYHVEFGTAPCSTGGCPSEAPVPPAPLTERSVNAFLRTAGVTLEDLEPGMTYHYRFVTRSSGGGPVYGIDPDAGGAGEPDAENGLEATFRTHPEEESSSPCPNDPFRIGPGADLPDCRAYEMVSPLDKGNADVALGIGRNNVRFRLFELNKTALSSERFTFTAAAAFADAKTAPFSSQYLAQREKGGWGSKGISPPRTESGVPADFNFGAEFHGFSDDLCLAWVRVFSVAPLVPGAVEKYPNLYRRHSCVTPPADIALTTVEPPNRTPEQYTKIFVKGTSVDGSHTIFTAPDKLHPDAPTVDPGKTLLYEHSPEELRFVCYLPNAEPISEACAAGTNAAPGASDFSSLHNAISDDGSRIFWTAYNDNNSSSPGRIFVRIDGQKTVGVSEAVSPDPAFFWTAAEDGSKALFSFVSGARKGELYEFDVDTETATLIAGGVEGPMGASEDASRVYFASTEDLDGARAATVGAHNLYFYEVDSGEPPGGFSFIMELPDSDVGAMDPDLLGAARRPVDLVPGMRVARITPDGLHATFTSAASPTPSGYDNRDADTGEPVAEVYRYDAVADELLCVSCNPTGARPIAGFVDEGVFAAARIQGWETRNHAPRVISDDGSRVFFESAEALVPDDANGTWDVYQWEEPGSGTCTTSTSTFSETSGGCVDLISSGKSASRSLFLDADPSGDNIFFSTQSSLVGQDYGLNDVYVARVGGGFPEPQPPGDCEGEACQNPPPPPPVNAPASESFQGPGNETEKSKGRVRCPKGKRRVVRKGKVRCVKKRKGHKRSRR